MNSTLEIARQFANSLDEEDYQATAELLSMQCKYSCRDQVYVGPQAILNSYRTTGDSAKERFDNIEYDSIVQLLTANTAQIHFVDHLYHNGGKHTFECEQRIEVREGKITRIEHLDLPGQREALKAFLNQVH